jgi:hypothetical protein
MNWFQDQVIFAYLRPMHSYHYCFICCHQVPAVCSVVDLLAEGNGSMNNIDVELEASVGSDCSEHHAESDRENGQIVDDTSVTEAGQTAARALQPSDETSDFEWPGISMTAFF